MAGERVERRLTAILAADVVGYSQLMGRDEEGTLSALKTLRKSLIDPKISKYHARLVKNTGDGALVEFPSAVDAVRCAIEIQRAMTTRNAKIPDDRRIEFRVGINVGDIIIDEGDIYGDGVNIAARVQALAAPGHVCLSENAYQQIKGKLKIDVTDLGGQKLKNIAQPVRVYSIRIDGADSAPALSLPDKPSIAVLPFNNMSGDPEQDYFADGMVEDITTALSRMRWLFVIARNSSFVYKGRPVDIKQVGRELGVRYVLEGSVRKAANRVRITGQLIDASNGTHLWADRFEGGVEDIFELQDQVTTNLVSAIAPKLEQAEIDRSTRKPTENLTAYDYFLRGMAKLHEGTAEGTNAGFRMFCRAIEIDPNFASAHGMAAWCYVWRKANGWMSDRDAEISEASRLARRATELGKDDAVALSRAAHTLAYVVEDLDAGATFVDRALTLNANLATAWYSSGWIRVWLGESELAIDHLARAMRLSPLDPFLCGMQGATAFAHFVAGRYDQSASWAAQALRERPNYHPALRISAASNAVLGRMEEARIAIARLQQLDPVLRVSTLKYLTPLRRPEHVAAYCEGLRKAGLPE
jgi:TolB-like protein/class 3 adenylate cyclase